MLIIITNQLTSCSNHQPVTQTTIKPLYNTQVNHTINYRTVLIVHTTQSNHITKVTNTKAQRWQPSNVPLTPKPQLITRQTTTANTNSTSNLVATTQTPKYLNSTSSNIPSNNALATEMLANNHIKKGQVKYRNLSQNTSTQGLTKQYETPQTITSFTQTQ
eukprot:gene13081-8927_t